MKLILESKPDGGLHRYDPKTKKVKTFGHNVVTHISQNLLQDVISTKGRISQNLLNVASLHVQVLKLLSNLINFQN